MSLIPWKPFSNLDNFFGDDDWMMPVVSKADFYKPAMDVYETDKEIVVKTHLPGFNSENVDISIEDNILRITGKIEEEIEDKKKGYWKKEIRQGSFERMVQLPSGVKPEEINAEYEKGVLQIKIPKMEKEKKEKLKVQIKEKK